MRILHGPDELNEALHRAAEAEQRVRVELLRRYGHYYGRTDWADFAAAGRSSAGRPDEGRHATGHGHGSDQRAARRWMSAG